MKFISWNVNGFRAVMKKGFEETFKMLDADFFCLQETKMQADQHDFSPAGYLSYFNYAQKKGYSGTAIFTKHEPIQVMYDLGIEKFDQEGRVITLEYEPFYLITCYTPNSKQDLSRLSYRMEWEDAFQAYCHRLSQSKPVIVCGDLNVAHQKIDLKNPSANRFSAGFTDEERAKMDRFLNEYQFVDTFRTCYPDQKEAYTWWSYFSQSRARNAGWRIDYFLTSPALKPKIKEACIYPEIMGSDHCPVGVVLDEKI